ncbi:MAG: FxDxF family PEP-CTERM protein [Hydrogenophilales bacterium]|nr:FxDxF family PEP-CTERM protein [Hydrogenophilales bacterium]
MKRTQFVLALALVGSMGSAAAAVVGPGYLGDLVGQNISIANTIAGLGTPIADIYGFDIGALTSEAIATSVKVTLQFGSGSTPVYDISNFAITLKDVNGIVYGIDSTFDSSGALNLGATLLPSTVAAPGFYQFVVSGTTAGTAGGIYAGALSAAPVPEPQTWLTLLAGLGLVGMMVERIKRRPG